MKDLPASIFQSTEWPTVELSEQSAITNAIMISLFTDQRVSALPKHERLYRGYWADSLDPKKLQLGSKLWTLSTQPLNEETLDQAIEYAHEGLTPLIPQTMSDLMVDGRISKNKIELQIQVAVKDKTFSYQLDLFRGLYAFI